VLPDREVAVAKLWLTYSWADNEDGDVDHVLDVLEREGLEMAYDRAHLRAGRRLWEQIGTAIDDPALSGWAFYVTENGLRSQPCQEELAYALDRALRTRGGDFPLIGIFPSPVDRELVPYAIATRLYVNLAETKWARRIIDAVSGEPRSLVRQPVRPFGFSVHRSDESITVEVWPKSGRWIPFVALVPKEEKLPNLLSGPRGRVPQFGAVWEQGKVTSRDGKLHGRIFSNPIDPINSAFIAIGSIPKVLGFGAEGTMYLLDGEEIRSNLPAAPTYQSAPHPRYHLNDD